MASLACHVSCCCICTGTCTSYGTVSLQGIVPESALSSVKELFVSDDLKAAAIKEAERLPRLDITQVNLHHYQSLTRHWDEYITSQQSE